MLIHFELRHPLSSRFALKSLSFLASFCQNTRLRIYSVYNNIPSICSRFRRVKIRSCAEEPARRFVLGWKKLGLERSLGSRIVTYADDLRSRVVGTKRRKETQDDQHRTRQDLLARLFLITRSPAGHHAAPLSLRTSRSAPFTIVLA